MRLNKYGKNNINGGNSLTTITTNLTIYMSSLLVVVGVIAIERTLLLK